MQPYSPEVERRMKVFFESLSEKDRRRYAAIEACKLGHGGIEYVGRILGCDRKTLEHGLQDLERLPETDPQGIRKKGGDAKSP